MIIFFKNMNQKKKLFKSIKKKLSSLKIEYKFEWFIYVFVIIIVANTFGFIQYFKLFSLNRTKKIYTTRLIDVYKL